MTAIAKEVVGERTVGLAVKVLNLNDHVPQGTLCEAPFDYHHPSSLAAIMFHRVHVPIFTENTKSSAGNTCLFLFVLTTSLLTAAWALGSTRLLGNAVLVPNLWIVGNQVQEMLSVAEVTRQKVPSLEFASTLLNNTLKCLRRPRVVSSPKMAASPEDCLKSTHCRCPAAQNNARTVAVAFLAVMLPASASAAPTNATVEKDVTCIVLNVTRASDCPIGNSESLTTEAQALIALGAVTVFLGAISAFFGVPQWAWKWFRRLVHPSAGPVRDAGTMNATAGGTIPEGRGGLFRYVLSLVPGLGLSRVRGARHAPDPHTPEQRDILVAGTGRGLDDEPTERPVVINDDDLELDDMQPPAFSPPQTPQPVVEQRDVVPTENPELIDDNDSEPPASPPQTPQLAAGQDNVAPTVREVVPQTHDAPKTLLGKSNTR